MSKILLTGAEEPRNTLVQYVKDEKGRLTNTLVCVKTDDDSLSFGWSKFNIKAESKHGITFVKKIGRAIAINRALTPGKIYNLNLDERRWKKGQVPVSVCNASVPFLNRCRRYFKVANIDNIY